MQYDFVAFGDIVIDAFIKLQDAEELVNHGVRELCVRFGEKVPFESVTEVLSVGNGPNAAVAAHKLGLASGLVVHVGDDQNGERCIADLRARGVDTSLISVDAGFKTNYHYILQFGPERTILIKHELYPYKLPAFETAPKWFYLTSLPLETLDHQLEIARYVKANGVKLAFQPGTFQIKLGAEALKEVYSVTEIFFCNKEEAQKILGTEESDIKKLMEGIRALGPKIVVVTDGPSGAYISYVEESAGGTQRDAVQGAGRTISGDVQSGTATEIVGPRNAEMRPLSASCWHMPMYPDPAPPVSRTGAGDATASTCVAYIIKGLEPKEALMRGLINAASVVQGVGAQTKLLTDAEVEEWYAKRPADFVATAL
ncbi:carbohydrate kinase family protein [Candidatus Kaiserbacteria bacterium]|nr:carbohydrate kinase family protein [Candidatus Kaiserbacteria bacterium]